ncbi:hypothetical protein CASFOL_029500 [Castilleja foliolosa]|uniref:ATP synthase F0 subunit 8 n=1 Tax=Castilleja foliolosa TaxID=1961234 RepID=A0ABD3C9E5_9LAMI
MGFLILFMLFLWLGFFNNKAEIHGEAPSSTKLGFG